MSSSPLEILFNSNVNLIHTSFSNAEQVWQYLKRQLRWTLPYNLAQLRQVLREKLEAITPKVIASITARQSMLEALSVARL